MKLRKFAAAALALALLTRPTPVPSPAKPERPPAGTRSPAS